MMAVLAAAVEVAGSSGNPVPEEAVAVLAWKRHPDVFGLAGYSDLYLDAAKVFAAIHKLVEGHYLLRVEARVVRVSGAGRRVVELLRKLGEL